MRTGAGKNLQPGQLKIKTDKNMWAARPRKILVVEPPFSMEGSECQK